MEKFANLFAFAQAFEEQVNQPQGMLANIGVPPPRAKVTKEDSKAKALLEFESDKLPREQKEVTDFLSSLKIDPASGIARHIRGPITAQLNSLFDRQYTLIKKTRKGKMSYSWSANEYLDNKRKIKRLMRMVEEVVSNYIG